MPKTTIGVIGSGQLPARMIRATFNDQLDAANGDLKLVLPLEKGLFSEGIEAVADWAIAHDVPIEVVTEGGKLPKAAGEFLEAAVKEHQVKNTPTGLVRILEKADPAKLFVFWDDEDQDGYEAFENAWDAEIPSYDLCNGLEELSFDDETDPEPPADEPESADEPSLDEEELAMPGKPGDEPEGDEEPTHEIDEWAELGRKTAKELKELCADKGITVNRSGKGRIAKGAYLEALKQYQETGATEYYQEEDLVGGTKPRKGETEPRKPAKKADPQPVDDAVDDAVDDDDDEEPETPDDGTVPEADEDEPVEIPSDDEDTDVEPGEEVATELKSNPVQPTSTSNTSEGVTTINVNTTVPSAAAAFDRPELVGNCRECGGPVFAAPGEDTWPKVQWFHAEKCVHAL